MEFQKLRQLGLTDGEIKIYDALLELGETTRTELAKKSGISPSKIYDVANRMMEKGIVSAVKKEGVLHFSVCSPERLKDFIEQKKEDLENEEKLVDSLLPQLMMRYSETKGELDVEVFYGWDGMKTAYLDIVRTLSKKDTNYIFGASMGKDPERADIFFDWYAKHIMKNGHKLKIIYNENVRPNKRRTSRYIKSDFHEVKFLHTDTFTELCLYKDTVLIIMLFRKPIVIRVRCKEAADSFMQFFETMWKLAKP